MCGYKYSNKLNNKQPVFQFSSDKVYGGNGRINLKTKPIQVLMTDLGYTKIVDIGRRLVRKRINGLSTHNQSLSFYRLK